MTAPRVSSSPTITAHRAPSLAAASSWRPSRRVDPSGRTRRPARGGPPPRPAARRRPRVGSRPRQCRAKRVAGMPRLPRPARSGRAQRRSRCPRWRAAERLHQAVIPTARPAPLGSLAAGREQLERRPGVVVEARTSRWSTSWSAEPLEQVAHRAEVRSAVGAEVIDRLRGADGEPGSSVRSSRTRSGFASSRRRPSSLSASRWAVKYSTSAAR